MKLKVIIIGGMAAGCKTAARLKRLRPEFDVTIVEKNSFLSYGTCGMPFYASGDVDDFYDLAKTSWGTVRDEAYFKDAKDVTAMTNTLVEEIVHSKKEILCQNLNTNKTIIIKYDYLVFATGAKPREPKFSYPKSDKISFFHSPLEAKKFRELAQSNKISKAAIIGGGYIGCELAESLVSLWGIETYLIEKENRLLPASLDGEISRILEKTMIDNKINLILSSPVKKIELNAHGNPVVYLESREPIETDFVFICTGVEPETALARSIGCDTGITGGIIVDDSMNTNITGVWAVGDCVEVHNLITGRPDYFPLGSLANRQGIAAADSIAGLSGNFLGTAGAVSIKVFDLIIASTGISVDKAHNLNLEVDTVCGCWHDRPDYHPDAKTIFGKLIYDNQYKRLLGLQMAGKGEVTRWIDIFTDLSCNAGMIYDLTLVEHAYTPPHSSPLNPLNFLGSMAINQENYGIKNFSPLNLNEFTGKIIDIREVIERRQEPFPDTQHHYTLSEYRSHINEFDKDEELLFICQKGSRAYEAARAFSNAGFKKVSYLGGGVQLAKVIID